jgi:general secretion pathway protein N
MRIRLPLGRSLFFLLALLFCILALLPLRLALGWLGLDSRGFAAREAIGSVWLGSVREAELGPVPIGDVGTRLDMLPLLIGRARIAVRRGGEANPLKGALTATRHGFGLDDADGSFDTAAAFAPVPIQSLDLSDVSVHFAAGTCRNASGLVRAQLGGVSGIAALPSGFSGEARCEGGALLLPLVSQSGQERLAMRLFDDGRYRIELSLPPGDAGARERLVAAGFAPAGANLMLRIEGTF